ncbi:GNAT family N-acetyltransferase [Kitasatospora sp. NPDC002227]|uniref:GNAT family N-acetyltransferase n=1 Tax=Kitasatospora sp. NPDC002227 TaxID=3154773 RepID=UPI0033348F6B
MRIERVGPEDWAQLREVRLRMLRDTPIAYQETYEQALELEESNWRARAARAAWPGSLGVVAVGPDGEWAGHMGACRVGPGQVMLLSVWVAPEHRGRSANVADRLLDAVLEWARADTAAQAAIERTPADPAPADKTPADGTPAEKTPADPPRMLLEVHETNARAIAFYTRRGFRRTGRTHPYPLDPGTREIEMDRPLQER